jgi:glucokinase
MVEAMPELILEEVRSAARARVMSGFRDQFKVVTAKLGDDAGVRGAAAWARATIEGEKR